MWRRTIAPTTPPTLPKRAEPPCFERHDLVHVGKGYALNFLLHRIWARTNTTTAICSLTRTISRPAGFRAPAERGVRPGMPGGGGLPEHQELPGLGGRRAGAVLHPGSALSQLPPHAAGLQRQRDRHRLSGERGDLCAPRAAGLGTVCARTWNSPPCR